MGCKWAKFDPEECSYYCQATDDECMFMFPDSEACARKYGEGPDAIEKEETNNE